MTKEIVSRVDAYPVVTDKPATLCSGDNCDSNYKPATLCSGDNCDSN